jgi:hypothetical protein
MQAVIIGIVFVAFLGLIASALRGAWNREQKWKAQEAAWTAAHPESQPADQQTIRWVPLLRIIGTFALLTVLLAIGLNIAQACMLAAVPILVARYANRRQRDREAPKRNYSATFDPAMHEARNQMSWLSVRTCVALLGRPHLRRCQAVVSRRIRSSRSVEDGASTASATRRVSNQPAATSDEQANAIAPLTRVATVSAFVAALALGVAAPASAQLYEVTHVNDPSWQADFGGDAAYDPVHDCYLAISARQTVSGRFINRDGATIGTVLFDARTGDQIAEVAYSPHLSDGAGGFGAFLAIWNIQFVRGIFGQIVSCPAGPMGPRLTIRTTPASEFEIKAGIAYSPVHHIFLVALRLFVGENGPTYILRLNQNAQPIDETPLSVAPTSECLNDEFQLSCNQVDVAWNPIANEFGVLYSESRARTLARVSGGGVVLSRTPLNIPNRWGALAVNSSIGTYLALGGADAATRTDGAEVSPDGALLGRGVVTTSLETDAAFGGLMRLSYSSAAGTFLLTGGHGGARLLELNQHGVPLSDTLTLPDSTPLIIASHGTAPQWLVATAPGTRYIFGTATPFGGSDARLAGCITPDPFVAFGGGTCVYGGWYPPGMIPSDCTTPDPFIALGGGRCINGGWYPPIVPAPAPPPSPTPAPGGCLTPDPFVAFGGGTCVNGGWFPPGMGAPAPAPPPSPGGCITPDPFVALGGGRCINGGWYPPGMGS